MNIKRKVNNRLFTFLISFSQTRHSSKLRRHRENPYISNFKHLYRMEDIGDEKRIKGEEERR